VPNKLQNRLNAKKIRDKRVSEQKCVMCGNKLKGIETYRCSSCGKKHNLGTIKRRKYLKSKNLCWTCHKPLDGSSNKYFCIKCNDKDKLRRNKYIQETKKRCMEYLGGKCSVCGLKTDFLSVYDFHHKNPEEKESCIRELLNYSWEKIEKELIKCILVCANCHRIIHFERDNQ
jgi:hypothetical protein